MADALVQVWLTSNQAVHILLRYRRKAELLRACDGVLNGLIVIYRKQLVSRVARVQTSRVAHNGGLISLAQLHIVI